MPKSIYFTDDRYEQIVADARKCGFRVSRGRGSQLAQYVVWASNTACSGLGNMCRAVEHFYVDDVCAGCGHLRPAAKA
jgi:hypothetical protein